MSIHLPHLDVMVANASAIAAAKAMLQLPPAELYQRLLVGREVEEVAIAARALIDHVLEGGLQEGTAIQAWASLEERHTLDALKEEMISHTSLIHAYAQRRSDEWRSMYRQAMLPVTHAAGRWLDSVSQVATQPCTHVNALLRQHIRVPRKGLRPLRPGEVPKVLQSDEVWLVGCYYLSLGMYGATYFPEIIATEWAYRWIALQRGRDVNSDLVANQARYDAAAEAFMAYDEALLQIDAEADNPNATIMRLRMRHAARVIASLEVRVANHCAEAACRRSETPPAARVAELITEVAPMTGKHHQNVRVGGQRLADRFADPRMDAAALVADLERSPFVRVSSKGQCPLLNGLKFGGSMFGVFSQEQHTLLADWIAQLEAGKGPVDPALAGPAMSLPPQAAPLAFAPRGLATSDSVPDDQRELFFQLVNIEAYPYLLRHAAHIVDQGLTRARGRHDDLLPGKYTFSRYFDYSASALTERMEEIYRNLLVEPYASLRDVPSKEEVVFQQMTAMLGNLIDGAWLAGVQACDPGLGDVRERLYEIYADEMGRGEVPKNHIQLIYTVLQSMKVSLPHVSSRAFIDQCDIPDSAYPFAIHQLALSLFPRERLPEIVGYNLAIEMFGLGELRMHEVQKLKHHGFDTSYEEVHLSIDNMATGHARSSLELTIAYLEAIRSQMGEDSCQATWRRVWDGYAYFAQFVERPSRQMDSRPAELVI